jgi:hypothetical protein
MLFVELYARLSYRRLLFRQYLYPAVTGEAGSTPEGSSDNTKVIT